MKLRPILFSTAMVQALLAGTKTQTRRNIEKDCRTLNNPDSEFVGFTYSDKTKQNTLAHFRQKGKLTFFAGYNSKFGGVGDVLWVRETWCEYVKEHVIDSKYAYRANCTNDDTARQDYIKAGYPYKWKSSMFMPKEACRLFLEITAVRVERLQDISEEDSKSEGVYCYANDDPTQIDYKNYRHKADDDWGFITAKESYNSLWESLNGPDSWPSNPFVWVYEFKRIEKPAI